MNILFLILKIIGILLLLVLVIAVIVLLHPVCYKVQGEIEKKISVKGYVWWLFQILRAEFEVEDSEVKYIRLRIFGIIKNLSADKIKETETNLEKDSEDFVEKEAEVPERLPKEKIDDSQKATKKSKSSRKKINIRQKISEKIELFRFLKTEITDEKNKLALVHILRELWYLLRHLKPKYIKANMSYATGDPALTGEVTGALSLLPLLYRYDAHIYPDFMADEFYIKGSFSLKGHLALYRIAVILIRLLRDKNIKILIYKFRK